MADVSKLYDGPSSGKAKDEADGGDMAENSGGVLSFSRWLETVDRIDKASGVPVKSKKERYEQWLKIKDKGGKDA